MTNLSAVIKDGMLIIEAKKILRESKIDNITDAQLVLAVFGNNKPIVEVIASRKGAIKTYEGVVKECKSKGEEVDSILRSIKIWKEELAVIESAMELTNMVKYS